ncbi:hypothetical protein BCR39DRAFT_561162 [Naematelia encephala]|uniref:Ubiquitin-like domain-containing protein n=1 Tax=Naematelia encephala TaxID=71784 RepID=A0A1Y2ARQ0_9TREE|nr:hypothetical protein BCR39DRAFT_561162 [Naematelia encephala]
MDAPADTPISGERINEERAFIKRYTEGLAAHKVEYPADYSTPLEDRPRKVAAVGVPLAEPPDVMDVDVGPVQDSSVSVTVKSLKPPLSFNVTAQLTDTVADLKTLVSKSSSSAPSPDSQRLLLKGKALIDTKLLKEYDIESGATIHLMVKASTPAPAPPPAPAPHKPSHASSASIDGPPTLTITTSVDASSSPGTEMPLTNMDTSAPPLGPQPQVSSAAFHNTVADPQFWQRIHALCVGSFAYEDDADAAWETFLISMKGRLSAGEAAKIRDVVGVRGMGGGA